jgi:hypothetical protein
MPDTLEKSHEPPAATRLNIAALEILENLYSAFTENANRIAAETAEAEGTGERINPVERDEIARKLIGIVGGLLAEKTHHLHQLQTEYLSYHLGIDLTV